MSSDLSVLSRAENNDQAPAAWNVRTRLSLGSLALATFALVFSEFLPAGLLTPMADGLGISKGLAGQAVTATGLSGMLSALLIGFVIGRIDRKVVMLALCALAIISNVAAALAPNFVVLLLARIVVGAAVGGFWTLAGAVVARLVSVDAIGKGMTIIFIGVSLATISAPPLGAVIAEFVGWRVAFAAGAAAAAVAMIVEFLVLPRLPASDSVHLKTVVEIGKRPMVQIGLLAVVAIAGGHFAGFTYVRPVLETFTHLAPTRVAEVLLAFGIANFLGNLTAGLFVDRRLRPALGATGVLIGASALSLVALGAEPIYAAASVIIWGFAFGAAPLILQTWTARAASDQLEAVGGLLVATFQIAIAVGAAIGGVIVDHSSVIYVLIFTGVMGFAATALAIRSR